MNRKFKNTILLIFAILIFAIGILVVQRVFFYDHGTFAVITIDGEEVKRLNLEEDASLTVESPYGGYNKVVVKNHKVSVAEADCENHLCVIQGEISESYEVIVCLPHDLAISIESK